MAGFVDLKRSRVEQARFLEREKEVREELASKIVGVGG